MIHEFVDLRGHTSTFSLAVSNDLLMLKRRWKYEEKVWPGTKWGFVTESRVILHNKCR